MTRRTAEERAAQAAEREWRAALAEHADTTLRGAIGFVERSNHHPTIRNAADQGGTTVEIEGPDGEWRRYFVRLTEVRQ